MRYLFYYLFAINIISFFICMHDKTAAKMNKRRISEKTLFLFCILGGGIGFYLGMQIFRHKTKHMSFVIGFPAILILELALAVFIIVKL